MKKKIYYIPGLISLLGLPILLLFFGPEERTYPTCLRLFLPKDDPDPPGSETRFSKSSVLEGFKNKKIEEVKLWQYAGNATDEFYYYNRERQFQFVRREIERLQFTHDTTVVLKIELDDDNTYQDFIWILNQATIYRIRRYAFFDNSFYLLTNDPPTPPSSFELSMICGNDVMVYEDPKPKKSKWQIFLLDLKAWMNDVALVIKHNYLLLSGLLLFIFIPAIIRMRKLN